MDGRQLRKMFADFNRQYLSRRLPQYHIRVGQISSSGLCNWRSRVITILPGPDDEQQDTLIHEMAHAVTKCGHSPKFIAELARLKSLGLVIRDACQGTRQPKPRLRKTDLVSEAMEALEAGCRAEYEDVIRGINDVHGYADSLSAFNRRYPWARRAFAEAKNKFVIYQTQVEAIR